MCVPLVGNVIAPGVHAAMPGMYAADCRSASRHALYVQAEHAYGAPRLVQVGDRVFTDVLYGNRNGTLTVLCEPLAPHRDPFTVKKVRGAANSLAM